MAADHQEQMAAEQQGSADLDPDRSEVEDDGLGRGWCQAHFEAWPSLPGALPPQTLLGREGGGKAMIIFTQYS